MVRTKLGTAHLQERHFPLAFREFFTAVELNPNNPVAHNQLGLTYILAGKIEQAEEHIKKALQLDPKYTDARINYSYLLLEQKKYESALKELQLAKKDLTYKSRYRISTFEGRAYFLKNQFKKAQIALRESILANRTYCPAHQYYGPTLTMLEDHEKAIKAIEHAINLCIKEKYPELYYYGALTYYHLGDFSRSRAKIKELAVKFPNSKLNAEANKILALIESKE